MTISSILIPLISAFAGGIIATFGNILVANYQRKADRKTLSLAFRGEMLAIIKIAEIRGYTTHLRQLSQALRSGATVNPPRLHMQQEYFCVYTENAARLGLIDPNIAEEIAAAYTYAKSFIEDATRPSLRQLNPSDAQSVEETLYVLEQAIERAKSAVNLINDEYSLHKSSEKHQ